MRGKAVLEVKQVNREGRKPAARSDERGGERPYRKIVVINCKLCVCTWNTISAVLAEHAHEYFRCREASLPCLLLRSLPSHKPHETHCTQMASALQHIHALGLAHLDLKPDNIYRARPAADSAASAPSWSGFRVHKVSDVKTKSVTRSREWPNLLSINHRKCFRVHRVMLEPKESLAFLKREPAEYGPS